MDYDDFAAAEKSGWSDDGRADAYIALFAPAADQLIPPLVAAVTGAGSVLDLCCGHGNATRHLVDAGMEVTGLDFSPAMLDRARRHVPEADFVEGDAADLPFADDRFDAVVCNVGFGHLPDPAAALAEIARVLRPGGVAALTSWREAEVSPTFQVFFGAMKAHGDPTRAPPAPDFHLFSRRSAATEVLAAAGFDAPVFADLDAAFELSDPGHFPDIFETATVRAAMLLQAQDPDARTAIRNAMTGQVREVFGAGAGTWRVPFPATMVSARRL
jgi:SAM-dependent methyltransferase